ncbi:C40 family peptidase [Corynebacterium qintianiae]|uniref:C40 family peptidase n=1 Tax=Corynebacterium qintianiae TaxID=2709392 RepID=A0A7T0KLH1_9CORY|nr:C40 family peptidase [Corynebacterium qintianiae]QPK82702.1 C40 family peptidase [Corynebacterium qintianiae]
MAQHRRQISSAKRNIAAASAVIAGATLLAPGTANAAEVRIPNSPVSVQVPGIENVPGIAAIPGIDMWIPSLSGQDSDGDVAAAIAAVKAIPGATSVPGFSAFIADVESRYAPAATQYSATAAAPIEEVAPAIQEPSAGQKIVDIARSKIGSPYVYGAAGPSAFDCSGFTSWVHAQAGKSIPRTSQAQASAGQPVALSDIQPGDVVVYYGGASHVAVYAGNGTIIDALNSGIPVGERPLDMMPIHSVVRF